MSRNGRGQFGRLQGHDGFVGFNIRENITGVNHLALGDLPLRDVAVRHRGGQRGHGDGLRSRVVDESEVSCRYKMYECQSTSGRGQGKASPHHLEIFSRSMGRSEM